jgi:hypothetical protein
MTSFDEGAIDPKRPGKFCICRNVCIMEQQTHVPQSLHEILDDLCLYEFFVIVAFNLLTRFIIAGLL